MPTLISQPTRIQAAGTKPKLIDEYVGRVNSSTTVVSVAHMRSPQGWSEPGQTPEFDEFTIVLSGMVRVTHRGGQMDVRAGQAVVARSGEWVQYSTPGDGGSGIYRGVLAGVFDGDGAPGWGLALSSDALSSGLETSAFAHSGPITIRGFGLQLKAKSLTAKS